MTLSYDYRFVSDRFSGWVSNPRFKNNHTISFLLQFLIGVVYFRTFLYLFISSSYSQDYLLIGRSWKPLISSMVFVASQIFDYFIHSTIAIIYKMSHGVTEKRSNVFYR